MIMLWQTIDNLTSKNLPQRAKELRKYLEGLPDQDLISFHRESVDTFLKLFTPQVYHLYCIAFDGEANGSGLTDFCSNLMLAGRSLTEAVLLNPDNFASVADMEPFNQDNGIDVSSMAQHILVKRYMDDSAGSKFNGVHIEPLHDIWGDLENQIGPITFEPAWQLAESTLPRIYARVRGNVK
ncbi:MAG: DUF4240 domain-containing protein [Verrucomicrobiaceae bacterium]|nr:DUF4240 domain-containing protein [Verrucomicrobiaceae bacterium]